jgi:hypothetical protein
MSDYKQTPRYPPYGLKLDPINRTNLTKKKSKSPSKNANIPTVTNPANSPYSKTKRRFVDRYDDISYVAKKMKLGGRGKKQVAKSNKRKTKKSIL